MYYSETTEILLEYQFSKAKHKTTIPWIMEAQQQFVGEFFYKEGEVMQQVTYANQGRHATQVGKFTSGLLGNISRLPCQ